MERITREDCEGVLKVICDQLGVPYADGKEVLGGNYPGNAMLIDANNPDEWRGRVETRDGRTPFGEWRFSKRELYYVLHCISHALEVKERLGNGTFGDYRKGY